MKNIFSLLLLTCITIMSAYAQSDSSISESVPEYSPSDSMLHEIVVDLDKEFFDAYNNCDTVTLEALISEDLEFYHDLGGLSTFKPQIIQALKDNICNKVTRELIDGTIEVYPIPGYGAVQMGWHQFHNSQEPNAKPKPSKFVTVWKEVGDNWLITRVISLH